LFQRADPAAARQSFQRQKKHSSIPGPERLSMAGDRVKVRRCVLRDPILFAVLPLEGFFDVSACLFSSFFFGFLV